VRDAVAGGELDVRCDLRVDVVIGPAGREPSGQAHGYASWPRARMRARIAATTRFHRD